MFKCKTLLLLAVIMFSAGGGVWAQKKIALPFDDLPCLESYSPLEKVVKINQNILDILRKNNIRSVVFVNEYKIHHRNETNERTKILEKWLDDGHDMGNSTALHRSAAKTDFEEFKADVLNGEKTISQLLAARGRKIRFFRYPYLEKGKNSPKTEKFLKKRGYVIVGASIDPKDWKFNAQYRAIAGKYGMDSKEAKAIRDAFLRNLRKEIEATLMRPNPEILLLHACTLTSTLINDIIKIIKQNGYVFCTLEEALGEYKPLENIEH
ncbi:MAG: polysaccharide deacetylase family protein [Puniceicoccales bacterium]|nr:polysaccharide deacetylase family protein [Puniceicoccales bacterium]